MPWKIRLSVRYVSSEHTEEPLRIRTAKIACTLYADDRLVYTNDENEGKAIKFPVTATNRGFEDLAIHGWIKHECKTGEGVIIGVEYEAEYATKGELLGGLRSAIGIAVIPGDFKKPLRCYGACITELERLIKREMDDGDAVGKASRKESEEQLRKIAEQHAQELADLERRYHEELRGLQEVQTKSEELLKARAEELQALNIRYQEELKRIKELETTVKAAQEARDSKQIELQVATSKLEALTAELQSVKAQLKEELRVTVGERERGVAAQVEIGKLRQALEESKGHGQELAGELKSVRERLSEELALRKAAEETRARAEETLRCEREARRVREVA